MNKKAHPFLILDLLLSRGICSKYEIKKYLSLTNASIDRRVRDLRGHQLIREHLVRKAGLHRVGRRAPSKYYSITRKGVVMLFSHELEQKDLNI